MRLWSPFLRKVSQTTENSVYLTSLCLSFLFDFRGQFRPKTSENAYFLFKILLCLKQLPERIR